MKSVEKFISPYIESQFPDFYKQEGPLFIAFVKAYYEWLESDRETLYHGRRLPEYRDIDKTLDEFILFFKTKYLSNIQFSIASNKKLFIKNSLDFYRSKGTPRSIDLFFKLIHGIEAKVYYPGDDVFKLSDNEFANVKYLEVEDHPELINMVGFNIRGSDSGAYAFAERLVKTKKGSRKISVLYISNVVGNFQTSEQIATLGAPINITTKILGSLSSLTVESSDANFVAGERLKIVDGSGKKGVAVVSETETKVGVVEFDLINPGYGYTDEAIILSSEAVLTASNVNVTNTKYFAKNEFIPKFESIKQDLVELIIENATDIEEFTSTNRELYVYGAGNILYFQGKIVSSGNIIGNNCTVILNYNSGLYPDQNEIVNGTGNTAYSVGNAESADIIGIPIDRTATANIIATAEDFTIEYSQSSNIQLNQGEVLEQYYIYQTDHGEAYTRFVANADVVNVSFDAVTSTYSAGIRKNAGFFRNDLSVERQNDGTSFSIEKIKNIRFGVIDTTRRIYPQGNSYGLSTNTEMVITGYETFTTAADIRLSGFNEEVVLPNAWCPQPIEEVELSTAIAASSYGLDLNPGRGFNDIISEALDFSNAAVGSIESIVVTNPGEGYPNDPFFVVYEPKVYHYGSEEFDFKITYNDGTGLNFVVGEVIEGQTSGTKARIFRHEINAGILYATRLSPDSDFVNGELIVSTQTGITTTVTETQVDRRGTQMGLNANVLSEAFSGTGFVSNVNIVSSGFGYRDDEVLTGHSEKDFDKTVKFTSKLEREGVGEGYFLNRKSFLSSDKYMHDNDYYQEYSYEILTALPFSNYKDTLIKVLHVAGNRPFGRYVGTSEVPVGIVITSSTSDFDLKNFEVFFNQQTWYDGFTTQHTEFSSRITNTSEFFEANIRLPVIIQDVLFVDSDVFFNAGIAEGPSEQVTRFDNTQTFYSSTVA